MLNSIKNFFKQNDFRYFILIAATAVCCYIFWGHTYSPLYDIGREAYFPTSVLEGKVLYKDIFNLFGPFSYLFTALMYKIFGTTFNTLYIIGFASSILVITGIYKLASLVLSKDTAFIISFFAISFGVTSINYCNASYTLPYASAVVYGMIACIWSTYFLVKGVKQLQRQNLYFVLSALLAGVSIANKYEYIFFSIFILGFILFNSFKKSKKLCLMALLSYILPNAVCFGFLFHQGLTFPELTNAFLLVKNIVNTKYYQFFYKASGALFDFSNILLCLKNLVISAALVSILYLSDILSKKYTFWCLFLLFTVWLFLLINNKTDEMYLYLSFLPLLVVFLFIFTYKKLDTSAKIIVTASILTGYKVLWKLLLHHYGVYFAPLLIIALFLMTKEKFKDSFRLFIILLSCTFIYSANLAKNNISHAVVSNDRPIFASFDDARYINETIFYIDENTKPSDKVVIYPEGLIINFITGRKSDDYYYALGPAYIDLFGEDNIINHFKENPPQYFIFMRKESPEYGAGYFCEDYAKKLCDFVKANYSSETIYKSKRYSKCVVTVYKKEKPNRLQ